LYVSTPSFRLFLFTSFFFFGGFVRSKKQHGAFLRVSSQSSDRKEEK
jgi:hypothetical protein